MGKIFNSIRIEAKNYGKAVGKEVLHGGLDTIYCTSLATANLVKACSCWNSTSVSDETKWKNDWKNTAYFSGMIIFSLVRTAAAPLTATLTKNQDYNGNLPVCVEMTNQHMRHKDVLRNQCDYTEEWNANKQYNKDKNWYVPYKQDVKDWFNKLHRADS